MSHYLNLKDVLEHALHLYPVPSGTHDLLARWEPPRCIWNEAGNSNSAAVAIVLWYDKKQLLWIEENKDTKVGAKDHQEHIFLQRSRRGPCHSIRVEFSLCAVQELAVDPGPHAVQQPNFCPWQLNRIVNHVSVKVI
jgi:hypothetical protein